MGKTIDITGKKFNKLTAISATEKRSQKGVYWLFQCECGNQRELPNSIVTRNLTKSCGCLQKIKGKNTCGINFKTHGLSKTRQYKIWIGLRKRCDNINSISYPRYGGRGITYDKSWLSFEKFWEDMKDGYSDHLSIDRINNNGNYCKENCKWSTIKEQNNNKRNNKIK